MRAKMSAMHLLYSFRDRHTNDGVTLEGDELGRLSLTLELDRATPRTLVLIDRAAARDLGRALLAATDQAQGGPDSVTLEVAS